MTQDTITITYADLKAKRACANQLAMFGDRFGDSVTFTRDDIGDKTQGIQIDWIALTLLSDPLADEYDRQSNWLLYDYADHRNRILAKYDRDLLADKYERQCAILFFDLYATQSETGQ
jgi:hypothetical protein